MKEVKKEKMSTQMSDLGFFDTDDNVDKIT